MSLDVVSTNDRRGDTDQVLLPACRVDDRIYACDVALSQAARNLSYAIWSISS